MQRVNAAINLIEVVIELMYDVFFDLGEQATNE
jgi:hypothetical protein